MNVYIDNLANHRKSIPLESVFGADTLRLYRTCAKIWRYYLHPYKGCYEANIPSIFDFQVQTRIPFNKTFEKEYNKFTNKWLEDHPDEKEKMEESKAKWKANFDNQFKVITQIADEHNVVITWCGKGNENRGDAWIVSKDNKKIGVFTV